MKHINALGQEIFNASKRSSGCMKNDRGWLHLAASFEENKIMHNVYSFAQMITAVQEMTLILQEGHQYSHSTVGLLLMTAPLCLLSLHASGISHFYPFQKKINK